MIKNERIATDLKKEDFFYDLPEEQIAQTPADKRDHSRLMVIHRQGGEIEHKHFYDIIDYLRPEDTLVVNNSKVIPARIFGVDVEKSDRVVEFLLLRRHGDRVWETLVRPGKKAKIGKKFSFGDGLLTGEITDIVEEGNRLITFSVGSADIYPILERIGNMPLPPYITEKLTDRSRYQTVYAKTEGSAAAPTAGLHFTNDLLDRIREKGIKTAFVTLHVGLGTFRPVKAESISEHHMHSELCMISKETADILNETRATGGRIVCVGTTSCRTLESLVNDDGTFEARSKWTEIFIYPGYTFKAMDALITNFHLPESTLVMLVSAFAGREHVLAAYAEAVKEEYRFFSFGDAMYIGSEIKK